MKRAFNLMLAVALGWAALCPGPAQAQEGLVIRDAQDNVVMKDITQHDAPKVVELLGSEDNFVRDGAMRSLEALGPKAVPGLLAALERGRDMELLITVLVNIRDERAIGPISRLVGHPSGDVTRHAWTALSDFGDAGVPALAGLLKDEKHAGTAASRLVVMSVSEGSMKLVRPLLDDPQASTRAYALDVLGEWKDGASLGRALELFNDPEPRVRYSALNAYGLIAKGLDQATVMPLLKDPDAKVRELAIIILMRTTPLENLTQPFLEMYKGDPDGWVRSVALYYAAHTNFPGIVPYLIEGTKDPDEAVVFTGVMGLGELKAKEGVPHITEAVKRALQGGWDEGLVQQAAAELVGIGEKADVAVFAPYLDPKYSVHTRRESALAIGTLGEKGDAGLIAVLTKYLAWETEYTCREVAEKGLVRLRE